VKILFLDFDGVLAWVNEARAHNTVCPQAVANLHRVVEATGCKIVVSSTWRFGHSQQQLCELLGLGPDVVIDGTPATNGSRGEDIQAWLDRYQPGHYAIVDDDKDMLASQLDHFVPVGMDWTGEWWAKGDSNRGLDTDIADRLIGVLNR
jgi:HAD domain in Swiss Army Knife RNA repair proteins